METSYKISATGIAPGQQEQAVRDGLQSMLRGDPATFEKTFQRILIGQPVVLVKGITEVRAQEISHKLTTVGLLCRVEPVELTLVSKTYRCPACGHEQEHADAGAPDTCAQCNVIGANYVAPPPVRPNELRAAMEQERRALAAQVKIVDEKETREAERKRAAKLRKIARRKVEEELGLTFYSKLRPFLAPRVSIPVVSLLLIASGATGWMLWDQQRSSSETALTADAAAEQSGQAAGQAGASGKPGGMQIAITPPPGLSVTVGAPPGMEGAAGAEGGMAGGASAGMLPGELSNVPASASGQTAALTVAIPAASTIRGSADANDPAARAASGDPRVLTGLAFYRFESGDLNTAAKLLDRVTLRLNDKTAGATPLPTDRLLRDAVILRTALAAHYAQRNEPDSAQTQWKRANRIAESITAADYQAMAYGNLGRMAHDHPALVAQKEYFRLATTAANRAAGTPLAQVEVLSTLARELTLAGQPEAARPLFDKATAAVSRIQERSVQPLARAMLAQQLAEAGDTKAAAALLAANTDAAPLAQRVTALAALAQRRAQQGETAQAQTDFTAAIAQAGALADPIERNETFVFIASHLVQAGNPAAAAQIIAAVGQ